AIQYFAGMVAPEARRVCPRSCTNTQRTAEYRLWSAGRQLREKKGATNRRHDNHDFVQVQMLFFIRPPDLNVCVSSLPKCFSDLLRLRGRHAADGPCGFVI